MKYIFYILNDENVPYWLDILFLCWLSTHMPQMPLVHSIEVSRENDWTLKRKPSEVYHKNQTFKPHYKQSATLHKLKKKTTEF